MYFETGADSLQGILSPGAYCLLGHVISAACYLRGTLSWRHIVSGHFVPGWVVSGACCLFGILPLGNIIWRACYLWGILSPRAYWLPGHIVSGANYLGAIVLGHIAFGQIVSGQVVLRHHVPPPSWGGNSFIRLQDNFLVNDDVLGKVTENDLLVLHSQRIHL